MKKRYPFPLIIVSLAMLIPIGSDRATTQRTALVNAVPNQVASTTINPLGDMITISNQASLVELSPAIAYNTARGEYLVVWYNDRPSNDDIRAQRISKYGKLLGSPFYISAAGDGIDRRYPRIAYNTKSDQYLVVWEHQEISSGYSIHGRRISGTGEVLDTSDLVIRSAGINLYTPVKPVVAYAYTSNKYLVVWQETWHPLPITTDIVGQVVLDTGIMEGNLITISKDPGGYFRTNPDLAYNLARNEYLVAWEQLDPNPNPQLTDIYTRRVTGNGLPLFPESTRIAYYTVSSTAPSVAAMPIQPDGQYFVTWELHYAANEWDIMGTGISPDGSPNTNVQIASTPADESQPSVASCLICKNFLVAWKEVTNPSLLLSNIGGRLVSASANPTDDLIHLDTEVANHPRTANGWLGDFMTVYEDVPSLAPDSGIYGHLIGNRVYLPLAAKDY